MRVVFVIFGLNSYSGAALQAMKLAEELVKIEVNIKIINIENSTTKSSFDGNVEQVIINGNIFRRTILTVKLFRQLEERLIHLHGFNSALILGALITGKKIVLKTTLDGEDDFESLAKKKLWFFYRLLISRISANVTLTQKTLRKNIKYITKSRIYKIPNGVKLNASNFQKTNNKFCSVGVVCERKGTLDAIKYFNDNYAKLDGSELLIVGPNDESFSEFDSIYYQKCMNFILENQLGEKVKFLGKRNQNEVYQIYSDCLALIFCSKREGLPNVLIEAMSHNCIPISTEIGGVVFEIIEDQKTGFILSNLSRRITIDEILTVQRSNHCINHIKDNFCLSDISKTYKTIYKSILTIEKK